MMTEKERESQHRYREKNREKLRARARVYAKEWAAKHPEKIREHSNNWKKAHPEQRREQGRRFRAAHKETLRIKSLLYVRKRYGLTQADVDSLFAVQSGRCGMCNAPIAGSDIQVDHDHQSGAVRGLLCRQCNLSLGIFEKYRKSAEAYLARKPFR